MKNGWIISGFVSVCFCVFANTHYVSPTGSNTAPYTSWGTAANRIQAAIDEASPGDTVLVGGGLYDHGYTTTPGYSSLNRVVITKNITVRSSDGWAATQINGKAIGLPKELEEVRCVFMTTGLLQGFTLTNGFARTGSGDLVYDQSGGGVFASGDAQIEDCVLVGNVALNDGGGSRGGSFNNCSFVGNSATNYGGGASHGTFIDCSFRGNSADFGGGASQSTLMDCDLTENQAAQRGGGVYYGSLSNCTFFRNHSEWLGGGASFATLVDCTLTENSAKNYGGGSERGELMRCHLTRNSAINNGGGGSIDDVLTECVLSENSATNGSGGGSYQGILTNCLLTGNSALYNGGGLYFGTLQDCSLENNQAALGGGSHSSDATHCTYAGNIADVRGGATEGGSLTDCTLIDNSAPNGGGVCDSRLNRCVLAANSANYNGGGAYHSSSDCSLTNCLLIGNSARWGGGTYNSELNHCTVKGNRATIDGGGCNRGTLRNSIITGNFADGDGNNLYDNTLYFSCTPDLTYATNVESTITNDPCFSDALFHLRSDSPCIDRANSAASITNDLDGVYRPLKGRASGNVLSDMGAYEYASNEVDSDGDGLSDAEEVNDIGADPKQVDTDGDGRADGVEVETGFSPIYDEAAAIEQGEANVSNNPTAYNLYTSNSIQDLNLGLLMLQAESNTMHLALQLKQTTNLTTGSWSDVGVPVNWEAPVEQGKSFFRVHGE